MVYIRLKNKKGAGSKQVSIGKVSIYPPYVTRENVRTGEIVDKRERRMRLSAVLRSKKETEEFEGWTKSKSIEFCRTVEKEALKLLPLRDRLYVAHHERQLRNLLETLDELSPNLKTLPPNMDPAEYQMLLAALWKKFDAIRRNNPSKAYERKRSGFRVMDEDRKAYVRWAYEDLGLKPPKEAAPR